MQALFPPSGSQDLKRFKKLDVAVREDIWYMLAFICSILERHPRHAEALSVAAEYYTALCYYEDGLRLDRCLAQLFPNDPTVLYNLACSLALTGEREEAFTKLAKAISLGNAKGYVFSNIRKDPDLASLRGDPRFVALATLASCL